MVELSKAGALSGQSTETESEVRGALEQVVLDSLIPIATMITLLFLVFAVFEYLYAPQHAVMQVTAINLSQMVCCFLLRIMLARYNIPASWANPILSALAMFLLLGIMLTFVFTADSQPVYMMLLMISIGSFMLSLRWLLLTVAIIVITWAGVVLQIKGSGGIVHEGLYLVIGALVSVAIHASRLRAYRRQELALADARQELRARRVAEGALRESEEKFRRISEQALVGIMVLQGGQIKYANEACFGLSGFAREDLLALTAQQHAEMIHPDD